LADQQLEDFLVRGDLHPIQGLIALQNLSGQNRILSFEGRHGHPKLGKGKPAHFENQMMEMIELAIEAAKDVTARQILDLSMIQFGRLIR
jgi:hypothetical protein